MTVSMVTQSGSNLTYRGLSVVVGTSFLASATYRLLEDHWVNDTVYLAGQVVVADFDFPINWIPTPNVDPLNTLAVNDFYNAGPGRMGFVAQRRLELQIPSPATYWKETATGSDTWVLTGLGSNQSIYPPVTGLRHARPG